MQPKDIFKGYKLARKSLKAYSIEMQYEIVFKDDRLFMLYLPSSYCSCCCSNGSEDGCSGYWYWGSSDGSASPYAPKVSQWRPQLGTAGLGDAKMVAAAGRRGESRRRAAFWPRVRATGLAN